MTWSRYTDSARVWTDWTKNLLDYCDLISSFSLANRSVKCQNVSKGHANVGTFQMGSLPSHAEPLLVFSLIVAAEKLRIVLDKKQPRWRKKVSIARQLAA